MRTLLVNLLTKYTVTSFLEVYFRRRDVGDKTEMNSKLSIFFSVGLCYSYSFVFNIYKTIYKAAISLYGIIM